VQKCHVHENPYSTFKGGCASPFKLGEEGLLLRSLALVPVSHRSANDHSGIQISAQLRQPCGYSKRAFFDWLGNRSTCDNSYRNDRKLDRVAVPHIVPKFEYYDRRVQPMTRVGKTAVPQSLISFNASVCNLTCGAASQETVKALGQYLRGETGPFE
jgi:hypothetical protein